MRQRNLLIGLLLMGSLTTLFANDKNDDIKALAEQWVKTVDANDEEALMALLHPQMIQFTKLQGKLIPFKGSDFAKMVGEKKLGGVPRKITIESANILRGETAEVVLYAVSEQYSFMYQISMAKDQGKWLIVSVLTDITAP